MNAWKPERSERSRSTFLYGPPVVPITNDGVLTMAYFSAPFWPSVSGSCDAAPRR